MQSVWRSLAAAAACSAAAAAQERADVALIVEGLRAGERQLAHEREPDEAPDERRRGRVVDATSGLPIAGATIETWTEEIDARAPGFARVGVATSGPDGGFEVPLRAGKLRAEKARIRAPGHLAAPAVLGELALVELQPRPAWTHALRVVDLDGRPLEGALVTTTYSCAHDVPAFTVATDADGLALLPEFGLQERKPQLRVRAAGHGAVKYLDLDELSPRLGAPPRELHLARRAPLRARAVDGDGRALAGATLHVVDGDGFHVVRTDARGAFEVAAPYDGGGDVTIYRLADGEQRHLFTGRLPRGREVPLGLPEGELPAQAARLALELPEGDDPPELQLFHASGWTDDISTRGAGPPSAELPAGDVLLLVGGAFTGWEEELVELSLAPGEERTLRLEPRREPRLDLLLPSQGFTRAIVQVGEDSSELPALPLPVPRGARVVAFLEGEDLRRAVFPPLEGDGTLDLTPASTRIGVVPQPSAERVRFTVRAPAIDGARLAVSGPGEQTSRTLDSGTYEVEAPLDAPVLLELEVPGHARCRSVVRATPDALHELRPAALARLSIASALELEVETPGDEPLEALHPGALELRLAAPDGRTSRLALVLRPGEHRTLRVD